MPTDHEQPLWAYSVAYDQTGALTIRNLIAFVKSVCRRAGP